MSPALRGLIAGCSNALVLGTVAGISGHINLVVVGMASLHAALECASQTAADRPSADDRARFVFAGLTLFAVYALAARSPHEVPGVLALTWLGGVTLRVLAMRTLATAFRSTTTPTTTWVHDGVFRFLEHPSEIGVTLCIASAPPSHRAPPAFLCATLALLLGVLRVHAEERAVKASSGLHRDERWAMVAETNPENP